MASAALASDFYDDPSPHHDRCRAIAVSIDADERSISRPLVLRGATGTLPTPSRKNLAGLTCSDIEAIVYATLGWAPAVGSAQECAAAAAIVGYAPGLASQIARPE